MSASDDRGLSREEAISVASLVWDWAMPEWSAKITVNESPGMLTICYEWHTTTRWTLFRFYSRLMLEGLGDRERRKGWLQAELMTALGDWQRLQLQRGTDGSASGIESSRTTGQAENVRLDVQ